MEREQSPDCLKYLAEGTFLSMQKYLPLLFSIICFSTVLHLYSGASPSIAAPTEMTGVGAWLSSTPYPTSLISDSSDSCVASSGYAYCVGGTTSTGPTNAVNFAPLSSGGVGTWMRTTSYPINITSESCVASSGYIYCIDGDGYSGGTFGIFNSVYYSALSSSGVGPWTGTTSYPISVYGQTCVANSGYVYCFGGISLSCGGLSCNAVYYASLTSNGVGNWMSTTAYPTGIGLAPCVAYSGYVYCVGGEIQTGANSNATYFAPFVPTGVGTWASTTSYPNITAGESCVIDAATIYCVGGIKPGIVPTPPPPPVLYATLSSAGIGPWNPTTHYPTEVDRGFCVDSSGYIFCIGGYARTNDSNPEIPTNAVYYAPITSVSGPPGNPQLSVIGNITVGNGPASFAYDPFNGYLYVTNEGSNNPPVNSISVISSSTNTVVATLPVNGPRALTYDPANHDIYVSNFLADSVAVFSSSDTLVANITGADGPLAYATANNQMYAISNLHNEVWAISSSTNTVVATIPIASFADSVAYDPANNALYVCSLTTGTSSIVSVISANTNTVVADVTVPYGSGDVTYDPSNNDIYVAGAASYANGTETNFVAALSGTTNSLVATIPTALDPGGLTYDPANGNLYVATHLSNVVQVISSSTNTVVANITGVAGSVALAYNPANQDIYAVTGSYNGTQPVGLAVLTSSVTSVALARVSLGFAYAITYDPANADMYVSNPLSDTVVVIRTTPSSVDIVTFTQSGLPSLPVGIPNLPESWSVILNGVQQSMPATTFSITFVEPNGTYSFSILDVLWFSPTPPSGSVVVDGADVTVNVQFTVLTQKIALLPAVDSLVGEKFNYDNRFDVLPLGPLGISGNLWNLSGGFSGSVDMNYDGQLTSTIDVSNTVSGQNSFIGYPEMIYGYSPPNYFRCGDTNCGIYVTTGQTAQFPLPIPVSEFPNLWSTVDYSIGTGGSSSRNLAYDIWITTTHTLPTPNSHTILQPGDVELMIWPDSENGDQPQTTTNQPYTTFNPPTWINGTLQYPQWDVWIGGHNCTAGQPDSCQAPVVVSIALHNPVRHGQLSISIGEEMLGEVIQLATNGALRSNGWSGLSLDNYVVDDIELGSEFALSQGQAMYNWNVNSYCYVIDYPNSQPSSLSSASTYSCAPTIEEVSPPNGPSTGNEVVKITGSGFSQVSSLKFGTTSVNNFAVSGNIITVQSPVGLGTVDVSVTSPSGTSAPVPADRFSFLQCASPTSGTSSCSTDLLGGDASATETLGPVATVSVSLTGSSASDGTSIVIQSSALSSKPVGTGELSIGSLAFFDVKVTGISDGTASICIMSPAVALLLLLPNPTLQYWSGNSWTNATDVVVSPFTFTVCGNVPVSALTGTTVVIGNPPQVSVSTFFTDSSGNSLASDASGSPEVNVVLPNGRVQSTNPGQILVWVNVTNTGFASLQSLKVNETLPVDWELHPAWLPSRGAINVYFEFTNGTRLSITNSIRINVTTGNPQTISLAISNLTISAGVQSLERGESILLSAKISYGLIGASQPLTRYPQVYVGASSDWVWMQPSFNGGEAAATGSGSFTVSVTGTPIAGVVGCPGCILGLKATLFYATVGGLVATIVITSAVLMTRRRGRTRASILSSKPAGVEISYPIFGL